MKSLLRDPLQSMSYLVLPNPVLQLTVLQVAALDEFDRFVRNEFPQLILRDLGNGRFRYNPRSGCLAISQLR